MVKIFLDTDFGPDCDDVGALQILHYLCGKGEAELIGVTHCTGNPYGLPAISALNRYNGREVPLGTTKKDFLSEHCKYNKPMAEQYPNEFADGRPQRDAVEVFREVMREQEDGSVTVCSIGPLNNLHDFLKDDECRRLIQTKVCKLVSMAGMFDGSGKPEWNVEMDVEAAQKVMEEWPGEIVFCPWECGGHVFTGNTLAGRKDNPVELAYRLYCGGLRQSWDLQTVLFAVRGGAGLMETSPAGTIAIDDKGVSLFEKTEGGMHRYTINAAPNKEIAAALDAMLCG